MEPSQLIDEQIFDLLERIIDVVNNEPEFDVPYSETENGHMSKADWLERRRRSKLAETFYQITKNYY